MIGRRGFITGLISLVAAPAIVRAGSLMPVKTMLADVSSDSFVAYEWQYALPRGLDTAPVGLSAYGEQLWVAMQQYGHHCVYGGAWPGQ